MMLRSSCDCDWSQLLGSYAVRVCEYTFTYIHWMGLIDFMD